MIEKISVLGAGTMGLGIVETFLMAGYECTLFEPFESVLKKAQEKIERDLTVLRENELFEEDVACLLNRLTITDDLKEAVKNAEFIIESIPENLQLKLELFEKLNIFSPEHAIIASNTSSLSFTDLVIGLDPKRHDKFMLCHYYNSANIIPLVELSYFGNMKEDDFIQIEQMYKKMGKVTIRVLKEIEGLVANRIQQAVAREVFWLIEHEIASAEDIDKALSFGPAFRYATSGQLLIADMGGLDIWCTVGDNLLRVMDHSTCANPILRKKVKENKLGIKSGEGFFQYPEEKKDLIRSEYLNKLIMQLKLSRNNLKL